MSKPTVCIIGTPGETRHHVAPFANAFGDIPSIAANEAPGVLRPGDLAIFYSEHFDRFRHCCIELKKRNVATLYMIDGILEWRNAWDNRPDEPACPWTMRSVLSHKVACIGPSQLRQLHHWGNAGKTELVGIPRLDSMADPMRHALETGALTPHRRECPKRRVMIATAKTPGFTETQIETTIRSLRDLQRYFGGQRTLDDRTPEVVWRVSPLVAERLKVDSHWSDLTGRELHDQLRSVDAVITTPSTLMLEGALLGLPVCLLNYHNVPTLVPAAWEIRHADQIVETVESLWDPPAVRMALQNEILYDSLQFHQNASERMVRLIESMLRIAAGCTASGQALAFPEHLLEPLPQVVQVLQLGRLFPALSGLGMDSVEQLAAEWAHSRREIDHLHRELAQAKSELAEAHRIFEQIQRHPIAGPIVRIRQSFLDWLQARPKEESTESS